MNVSKYKVYIPESGDMSPESLKVANVLFLELANYGIELDTEAFFRLTQNPTAKAVKIAKSILAEYTAGQLNQPLFANWEDRNYFSFNERVVQILGYCFQLSGNDIYDPNFMAYLRRKVDFKGTKKMTLVSPDEFREYFNNLVSSNVTLDRATSQKLETIFDIFGDDIRDLPRIKSHEIRIAALLSLVKTHDLYDALKALKCNASDVLRYAAAKRDFIQFKLPAGVLYDNLNWGDRVDSFRFLNEKTFDSLCEEMGMNRGAWQKYLKHTHFFGQKGFINRFNNFYIPAFVSSGSKLECANKNITKTLNDLICCGIVEVTDGGNLAYRTFASRVQSAIEDKNWEKIKGLISERKGYLFRNFATVCNGIQKKDERDFVKFARECIPDVDVGILFSILSIDIKAKHRIIDVKGDTIIEDANYPKVISAIQMDIEHYIRGQYGFDGKVEVDDSIKDNIVPFLSKNSELPRGTRIPLGDKSYLYLFVHWVQKGKGYYNSTDIDHSFMCFNALWKHTTVNFRNQANGYITQSGDITDAPAPHGATEYGKVSLEKIPSAIKYIASSINVYSGDQFSDNEEVRAGFFLSDRAIFSLKREMTQFNLTQPAHFNIPFVLDVEKREIIVLDYNRRDRMGWTTDAYATDVKKVISATNTKNYITIGKLAEMLSGDSDKVSKKIVSERNEVGQILPEDLFSLFSNKK